MAGRAHLVWATARGACPSGLLSMSPMRKSAVMAANATAMTPATAMWIMCGMVKQRTVASCTQLPSGTPA